MLPWALSTLGVLLAALVVSGCGGSPEARPDLAFVSTRDGPYAIFEMNADGGAQHRLTESDADATTSQRLFFQVEPAWSPEGTRIAFASRRGGSFDLYAMNADGTGTHRLTASREDDAHPTWSADGGEIAFARGEDIFVMRSDGSDAHRISDPDVAEREPAWSPTGEWIAFVRRNPGIVARELWLMRPDGSEARRLTSLGATSVNPAWSPDGRRIAFSSNVRGGLYDIFTLTVGKKGVRRLTSSGPDAFEPSWSPDGRTIAFAQNGSIKAIDMNGTIDELTESANNDSSPVWNPRPPAPDE